MDDMVPEYKKRMARFRLQELKEVLGQLGLARTGRKQDLMDRILALLSNEEDIQGPQKNKLIRKEDVAKIIDDTYGKMPHMANENVTSGHCVSDSSSITPKEEIVDQKIRCPCGNSFKTEFMIQCEDPQCHTLQHIPCVIIPVDTTEGVLPPSLHYCEICRIDRCDPFWKTLGHPLSPVKLVVSSIPDDGSEPLQNVDTSFQITRANVHLLEKTGYDVQAWCILLNDSVPFRMQWPQYPDLRVNGIPVKTISRPGSKMLGANGRDDGPSISVFLVEGHNTISLSGSDTRPFCLGVRLVKQRTMPQVISMIPDEQEGESFSEAVARVCRCIGGGMAAANDDSDSDLEVIADNVTINLRCPMSGCRMKTAARFKACIHLGCFDLHTLVQINQRSRKWQCPICLKNYSLEDIIIDPYLNRIVKKMQPCDEDVTEIEVKSDGSWRTKMARPYKDLERWHLPEGSLCTSEATFDSNMEVSEFKREELEGNNQLEEYIISMSSGSSDEIMKEDDEIQSMNNNDSMMQCNNFNNNQTSGITNRSSSSSLGDPSVIVLSDSDEEENCNMVSETPDVLLPPGALDVKGECSEMSNNGKGSGDPFTFPQQPRTVRRHNGTAGD